MIKDLKTTTALSSGTLNPHIRNMLVILGRSAAEDYLLAEQSDQSQSEKEAGHEKV